MVLKAVVILASLSLVDSTIFKRGFDYIYSYEGCLKIGTEKLSSHYSYTKIVSDIHITSLQNGDLLIQFRNVNSSAFSGSKKENIRSNHLLNYFSLLKSSNALTLPFLYNGYSDDRKNGMSTKLQDQRWSRNMKQALVQLLQLDKKVVENESHAFLSDDGFQYYVLLNQNSFKITRMKSGDRKKPGTDNFINEENVEMPFFMKHMYIIEKDNDNLRLANINASGMIDYSPFNGKGDSFYVRVDQKLYFKDEKASSISQTLQNEEMVFSEFDSNGNIKFKDSEIVDIDYEPNKYQMEPSVKMMQEKLIELAEYLRKSHLTLSKLISAELKYVDYYTYFLKMMNEDHLKELYSMISKDDDLSQLFLKLVSLTRTSNSHIFILDLVSETDMSEQLIVQIFENMAAHPTHISKILKDKYIKLIKEKSSFSETIKRQIVLSFTSSVPESSIMYEEIYAYFQENLKKSKREADQLVYIYALRNINVGKSSADFILMSKAVEEYKILTTHARSQAMYGLKSTSEGENCLWFLLENKKEEFEIRVTSFHILMDGDFPQNYERVVWLLVDEDDDNIQHLLYTELKSISETTLPSFSKRKARAKQLLAQLEKRRLSYVKASSFIYDFFEESKGTGISFQLTYFGNLGKQNFTQIHLRIALQTSTPKWEQHDWYMHLQRKSNKRVKFNNLFDLLEDSNYDGVVSSITKVKNDCIVSWHDFTIEDIIWMLNSFDVNNYFTDITQRSDMIVSSDMGIPVVFVHHRSYIFRIESHFERASLGKFTLNFVYRGIEKFGFTAFNSVVNLRNGISRVQAFDGNFPLDIDFNVEPENSMMKMTINIGDEPFGFQSFSYSEMFVKDDNFEEVFLGMCPNCKNSSLITNGENKLENLVLLKADLEDFGLQYELSVFDCEMRLTASYFPWGGKNLIGKLLGLIVPHVEQGMCGKGLKIQKSQKYPATRLDITVQEGEISTDRTVTWSRSMANVSYSVKHDKKLIKSWNIDAVVSTLDESKYELDLKMESAKDGVPGDILRVQANDVWLNDRMNAFRKISFNNSLTISDFIIMTTATSAFELENAPDLDEVFTMCDANIERTFGDCLREVSSYRAYSSVVCYSHLNKDQMYYLEKLSDFFKLTYPEEFVRMEKLNSTNECFSLMSAYALYYDSVNVTVITSEETYRYDDIFLGNFYRLPHVVPYSKLMFYNYLEPRYCEVNSNFVTDIQDGDKFQLKYDNDSWAYLSAQCNVYYKSCRWLVKTKKINGSDDLVLHIQVLKDIIEVSHGNDFKIVLNGKSLEIKKYNVLLNVGEHMDLMMMSGQRDKVSRIIIRMKKDSVIAEYTRTKVRLSLPWHFIGKCYIDV